MAQARRSKFMDLPGMFVVTVVMNIALDYTLVPSVLTFPHELMV